MLKTSKNPQWAKRIEEQRVSIFTFQNRFGYRRSEFVNTMDATWSKQTTFYKQPNLKNNKINKKPIWKLTPNTISWSSNMKLHQMPAYSYIGKYISLTLSSTIKHCLSNYPVISYKSKFKNQTTNCPNCYSIHFHHINHKTIFTHSTPWILLQISVIKQKC